MPLPRGPYSLTTVVVHAPTATGTFPCGRTGPSTALAITTLRARLNRPKAASEMPTNRIGVPHLDTLHSLVGRRTGRLTFRVRKGAVDKCCFHAATDFQSIPNGSNKCCIALRGTILLP